MDKILILGGTNFIGRVLTEALTSNPNIQITLFNRGITNAGIFPTVERVVGDRNVNNDVQQISKTKWDYVIDLSCYYPHQLEAVMRHVNKDLKRYLFISTCSVYCSDQKLVLRDEKADTWPCSEEDKTDHSSLTYGPRKAECERILQKSSFSHSILRPALVYGPFDNTDRLYYWLYQVRNTSQLLVPGMGTNQFSITFVKDLVQAIVQCLCDTRNSEILNIISHQQSSITEIIELSAELFEKEPYQHYADTLYLINNQVNQWLDIPLWLDNNYFTFDSSKMISELGIVPTDFERSLQETIAYYDNLHWKSPACGISEERKLQLIKGLSEGLGY
ncbi:MAG: NAD-dependent epimerase/dehydratase family protein [Bacteroidales bacterium]|nr:NAD-dependent epimerase/dehydratase family protein [Bacteroidales bacterium]